MGLSVRVKARLLALEQSATRLPECSALHAALATSSVKDASRLRGFLVDQRYSYTLDVVSAAWRSAKAGRTKLAAAMMRMEAALGRYEDTFRLPGNVVGRRAVAAFHAALTGEEPDHSVWRNADDPDQRDIIHEGIAAFRRGDLLPVELAALIYRYSVGSDILPEGRVEDVIRKARGLLGTEESRDLDQYLASLELLPNRQLTPRAAQEIASGIQTLRTKPKARRLA